MKLPNSYIIALRSIKGLGASKLEKIAHELEPLKDVSWKKLHSLLIEMVASKRIPKFDIPEINDFCAALKDAEKVLRKSESMGIYAVSRYQENFPKMLLSTVDEISGSPSVPSLIWYKGDLSVTKNPALAVIGTREPTEKGMLASEYYAEAFASIGMNIVSGLALGCDTYAHKGALRVNGGITTAILANGLDTIYPKENASLADEILEKGGLIISEYPIRTRANRYSLIARDRLQAGLSNATLVVQTELNSGTFHAINATVKSGKPLFVVGYNEHQGNMTFGNNYVKEFYHATEFRDPASKIKANPDEYLKLMNGPHNDTEPSSEPVQGTIVFD